MLSAELIIYQIVANDVYLGIHYPKQNKSQSPNELAKTKANLKYATQFSLNGLYYITTK